LRIRSRCLTSTDPTPQNGRPRDQRAGRLSSADAEKGRPDRAPHNPTKIATRARMLTKFGIRHAHLRQNRYGSTERWIRTLGRPLDSETYRDSIATGAIFAMVAAPHCTGCTGDLHFRRTVIRRAGGVSLHTRRSARTTACVSDDLKTQRVVARTLVHGEWHIFSAFWNSPCTRRKTT